MAQFAVGSSGAKAKAAVTVAAAEAEAEGSAEAAGLVKVVDWVLLRQEAAAEETV
jgi:hypothetical protein